MPGVEINFRWFNIQIFLNGMMVTTIGIYLSEKPREILNLLALLSNMNIFVVLGDSNGSFTIRVSFIGFFKD